MTDANETARDAAAAQLPLFYRRPEAMNPVPHGSLSLVLKPDFAFAVKSHAIPLVANEMPMAMRSYPIVFVGPHRMPIAITGLRGEENLFVRADGRWEEPHYIPAYVRRYPFILAHEPDSERLTLCIDRSSDRIVPGAEAPAAEAGTQVQRLFDGTEPSETTRKALDFCQQFEQGHALTRRMIETISRLDLFAERRSTVTLSGGEVLNLTDFQVIDEARLGALGDADFLELRRQGALAMIYCHLASLNSWPSVIHQAQLRKAASLN